MKDNQVDYAISQFLHKRFVPRPGVDRVGRHFSPEDMPVDGQGSEEARHAQSLCVNRVITKHANPCDDVFEVETNTGQRIPVRMEWLRRYWTEAGR